MPPRKLLSALNDGVANVLDMILGKVLVLNGFRETCREINGNGIKGQPTLLCRVVPHLVV